MNLKIKPMFGKAILFLMLISGLTVSQAQPPERVWELMERRDLKLSQIDSIAKRYFDRVGRVRGTGHKQFERWKFEKQFHLDNNGFLLPDNYDQEQYESAAARMPSADAGSANAIGGAWTELGPTYWSRTSSWNPGVGRITAIAVFPANPDIIYVTSPGGGVWKTTQGGNQWAPLSDYNNSMMDMFSIAVHPSDPNIVFAGNSGGNIFKSTDGGITWSSRSSGIGSVKKILINPLDPNIMFAAANGVYKSTDGGNTWTRKVTTTVEDIEFKPGNTAILYASGKTVLRSLNAGETWSQLGSANGINTSDRSMIGVSVADSNVVYVVQAKGSEFGFLYKSVDGGNSFITTVTGSATTCTNFFGYSANGCSTGGQAWYDMAITVNPQDANEVHIGGVACWKSINGGFNFVATTVWSLPNTTGYNHADIHALEYIGNVIYSGSDGGIYKSTDFADNWTDLSNGLGIRQFYRIAISKTSTTLTTGGAQDNGSSALKRTGWIDWLGADGMDCLISPSDSNLLWGTSQYGSLYRSINGGSSYSNLTKPAEGNWVTPLAIESNSNIIYSGYDGVYKSTNNGTGWSKISGTTITSNLSSLAVAPSNPNYIYASNGSGLFVTKDGGATWSSYGLSGISITSFAIHPGDPEKVWISSSNSTNSVLLSTNAGATFTNISGNLPSISARSIVIDNSGDEGLYVAMNIGVYYKNKFMTDWVNLTDNLPLVAINEVELQVNAGKVRVGTYGRGLWERDIYNPCNSVSGLQSLQITDSSADLSWTASVNANGYNVDYKISSSSTWTSAATGISQSSFSLSGLQRGTSYDWRVNAQCVSGNSGFASASFTTTTPCGDPSALSVNNLTPSTATLNWSSVAGALYYSIYMRRTSETSWNLINDTNSVNSYNLTGLSEGTQYEWKVSATCSAGTGNEVSNLFTTPVTCSAPGGLNSSSIASTSATISWSGVSSATGYDVDYKAASSSTWISRATNLNALSTSLTGLTGGTAYNWRVRANCGALSGYSPYSEASFTTLAAPCTDVYEANNTSKASKTINLNTEISAIIGSSTDVDWFKFTSPNTTATNIRVTLYDLPANYNVYLYDKNLVLRGSGVNTGTTSEIVIYNSTLKRALYYVKVEGVGGAFSTTCYKLKVETSSTAYRITADQPGISRPAGETPGKGLQVFPVPARDNATISFFGTMHEKGDIIITDIAGHGLESRTVDIIAGQNHIPISLKGYPSGMYIIRLRLKSGVLTEKIVVE